MATTFDLLFLDIAPEIDTVEGNRTSEIHQALEGLGFGSATGPLAPKLETFSATPANTYTGGSNADAHDANHDANNASYNVVDGASGNDLINASYTGDPKGDRVDANDTLAGNNDDMIDGGTGRDTLIGGEGDETGGDTLILPPDTGRANPGFANKDGAVGGLSGTFTLGNGTVAGFSEIENIICFTPGARILTQWGERPIESLRPGDMVVTRDHGVQPIRWIGKRSVPGTDRLAPVEITPSVMGGSGLLISPQHRVLFTGYAAELLFGESEVLVAAKHLVNGRDVRFSPCAAVTYIHIMFDRHEVIYADGIATESFFVGDSTLAAVDDSAREELFALFPELRSAPGRHHETARTCLKEREVLLLRDHLGQAD